MIGLLISCTCIIGRFSLCTVAIQTKRPGTRVCLKNLVDSRTHVERLSDAALDAKRAGLCLKLRRRVFKLNIFRRAREKSIWEKRKKKKNSENKSNRAVEGFVRRARVLCGSRTGETCERLIEVAKFTPPLPITPPPPVTIPEVHGAVDLLSAFAAICITHGCICDVLPVHTG